MERLCFTFETYPGTAEEYKRRHDEIWPDLVADIKSAGMSNYSLFRQGDRVIGYVECDPDAATCVGKLSSSEANSRWSKWFENIIVSLTDENGQLQRLDEVWHLD